MLEVYELISSPSCKLLFVDFGINMTFFLWLIVAMAGLLRAKHRQKWQYKREL